MIESPQDQDDNNATGNPEPCCLEPCRRDGKLQGCTQVVPDAVTIARDDMKPVRAGAKVCIERLPTAPGVNPVPVPSIQPVPEPRSFWNGQAQSRIVNAKVLGQRRKRGVTIGVILRSVYRDRSNRNRRG